MRSKVQKIKGDRDHVTPLDPEKAEEREDLLIRQKFVSRDLHS